MSGPKVINIKAVRRQQRRAHVGAGWTEDAVHDLTYGAKAKAVNSVLALAHRL